MDAKYENGELVIRIRASDNGKLSSTGQTKQFAYGQTKIDVGGRTITVQVNAYEKVR